MKLIWIISNNFYLTICMSYKAFRQWHKLILARLSWLILSLTLLLYSFSQIIVAFKIVPQIIQTSKTWFFVILWKIIGSSKCVFFLLICALILLNFLKIIYFIWMIILKTVYFSTLKHFQIYWSLRFTD